VTRWSFYCHLIEAFDLSLPGHRDHGEWLPDPGWPLTASHLRAKELRGWLRLSAPVPKEFRSQPSASLFLLLRGAWLDAIKQASHGDFSGIENFGIQATPETLGKGAVYFTSFNLLVTQRRTPPGPEPSDIADVLHCMVSLDSASCPHDVLFPRVYGRESVQLCLRCGCLPNEKRAYHGIEKQATPERIEQEVHEEMPQVQLANPAICTGSGLDPSYAHLPGTLDPWPVGQAPGEAERFSSLLASLGSARRSK
jgi:hypothetical protein